MLNSIIVETALGATTEQEAIKLQDLIESAIGDRYPRPVGDRPNNIGLLTASGSKYDHKILELVTNMQDSVLEKLALDKFGSRANVPFTTPHEAAAKLLEDLTYKEQANYINVTLEDCGMGKKSVTIVARDYGTGMTPSQVPNTIFHLGAGYKDGVDWQQGNFGLGGATTLRNATTAILVTRRDPILLESHEEDRITVAVVQWRRERTTNSAFYLVTTPWARSGDLADPFSVPSKDFEDFGPGTHLALIGYNTEGLARKSGDERSFDTVFNTRLYDPVLPITYRNLLVRPRPEYLRGLKSRLEGSTGEAEGHEVLPFSVGGNTYQIPIRYRLFSKPGDRGSTRNFIAKGHALIVTSNGQTHYHWSPQEFRSHTKHKKLYNRIFVVVESDALPIDIRTELFTADRSQMVQTDAARRLEEAIISFLNDWAELRDHNSALIREAIAGDASARHTIDIARKISRSLKVKGFSTRGRDTHNGGTDTPLPADSEDLYEDPTHFEGPESVSAVIGKTRGIYFKLNAVDDFIPQRADISVTCTHPDIGDDEIAIGQLKRGRVRITVSVPDHLDQGECLLNVKIDNWVKSSGGLGMPFDWRTVLDVVDELEPRKPNPKPPPHNKSRMDEGNLVAVIWKNHEDEDKHDDWDANTVGEVQLISGDDLASERPDYRELAGQDISVPTIILNRGYAPLKTYIHARARDLTDRGREAAEDRYAVGIGVGMIMLFNLEQQASKEMRQTDPNVLREAQRTAARSVLSVLPEYDNLARQIEEGDDASR
ncbi:MAG: hypothetical protein OXH23_05210 [bacterium]|nr:hypothetical protein [bacterium]